MNSLRLDVCVGLCAGEGTDLSSLVLIEITVVTSLNKVNHSQHTRRKKESAEIKTEKQKISGSATGYRTQGLWFCAPALRPLSITPQSLTALNVPLLDVYQCQRYTVRRLPCYSLQPHICGLQNFTW